MNKWQLLASMGGIGYLPMPGSLASLCALALLYALFTTIDLPVLLMIIGVCSVGVHYAVAQTDEHDPSYLVLDEVAGVAVAAYGLPRSWFLFCAILILFRFFDIAKPFFIARLDGLHGATGIMLDDIAAGLVTNLLIRSVLVMAVF